MKKTATIVLVLALMCTCFSAEARHKRKKANKKPGRKHSASYVNRKGKKSKYWEKNNKAVPYQAAQVRNVPAKDILHEIADPAGTNVYEFHKAGWYILDLAPQDERSMIFIFAMATVRESNDVLPGILSDGEAFVLENEDTLLGYHLGQIIPKISDCTTPPIINEAQGSFFYRNRKEVDAYHSISEVADTMIIIAGDTLYMNETKSMLTFLKNGHQFYVYPQKRDSSAVIVLAEIKQRDMETLRDSIARERPSAFVQYKSHRIGVTSLIFYVSKKGIIAKTTLDQNSVQSLWSEFLELPEVFATEEEEVVKK